METKTQKTKEEQKPVNNSIPTLNYEYLFFELHQKVKDSYGKHESLSHNRAYDSGILLGMMLKEMELITTIMDQAVSGKINFVIKKPNPNNVDPNNVDPNTVVSMKDENDTKLYI